MFPFKTNQNELGRTEWVYWANNGWNRKITVREFISWRWVSENIKYWIGALPPTPPPSPPPPDENYVPSRKNIDNLRWSLIICKLGEQALYWTYYHTYQALSPSQPPLHPAVRTVPTMFISSIVSLTYFSNRYNYPSGPPVWKFTPLVP